MPKNISIHDKTVGSLSKPVNKQGTNVTVGTVARKKPLTNGPLFVDLSPFTNCTVVSLKYCRLARRTAVTFVRQTAVS